MMVRDSDYQNGNATHALHNQNSMHNPRVTACRRLFLGHAPRLHADSTSAVKQSANGMGEVGMFLLMKEELRRTLCGG